MNTTDDKNDYVKEIVIRFNNKIESNNDLWKHVHIISLFGSFCYPNIKTYHHYSKSNLLHELKLIFGDHETKIKHYIEMFDKSICTEDIDDFNAIFRSLITSIYMDIIRGID